MSLEANGYWARMAKGRTSRRSLLRGAALGGAGLAAAALVGCGGEEVPAPTPPPAETATGAGAAAQPTTATESEIKRGGTFHDARTNALTDVPDPHTSLAQAWSTWTWFGEGLVEWSRDATEVAPLLLESWEQPSADGLELVLHARKGVQWHDRPPFATREFDAEDVAYNIKRISGTLGLPADEGKVFHRKSSMQGMIDAVPVDSHTVKVTFEAPSSVFITGLTNGRSPMVPREFPEQFEFDYSTVVGTGAWIVDSFQDEVKGVLRKNPQYWREGQPYMDSVEWLWVPDAASSQAAFAQGEFEWLLTDTVIARGNIAKLAPKAQLMSWPYNRWDHFRFNVQRKPFDDPRVRKAMQLVINPSHIGDSQIGEGFWQFTGPLAAGFGEAISSEEIAKTPGWNPDTKEQDVKTAKDLMAAAGFPDGDFSFGVMTSGTTAAAEIPIRGIDMWNAVWPGMKAAIDPAADSAAFGKRQGQSDFDVVQYTFVAEGDAQVELASGYLTGGGRNYGKFSDPKVDEMLTTARQQINLEERKETLLDVQHLIIEEHMSVIPMYVRYTSAYIQPWVKGYVNRGPLGGSASYDTGQVSRAVWLDK